MSLGYRIQKLRKSRSLSQEAFASVMNVSRQSVSKWELDQTYPEINKLIEIADYFNISLDELLRENKDETKSDQNNIDKQILPGEALEQQNIHAEDNVNKQTVKHLFKPKKFLFIAFFLLIGFYCLETGRYSMLIAYLSSAFAVWFVRFIILKAK